MLLIAGVVFAPTALAHDIPRNENDSCWSKSNAETAAESITNFHLPTSKFNKRYPHWSDSCAANDVSLFYYHREKGKSGGDIDSLNEDKDSFYESAYRHSNCSKNTRIWRREGEVSGCLNNDGDEVPNQFLGSAGEDSKSVNGGLCSEVVGKYILPELDNKLDVRIPKAEIPYYGSNCVPLCPENCHMGNYKGSTPNRAMAPNPVSYQQRISSLDYTSTSTDTAARNRKNAEELRSHLTCYPTYDGFGIDRNTSRYRKKKIADYLDARMTKKKMTEKKYHRHAKPPYSYVGLIALAIQSSPTKMLKLSDILTKISTMFPFFKGEYQGWRDSVRHNLSQNACFTKVLPDPSRPHSKGNFWTVDVTKIPPDKLKRQNTSVSRNVAPGFSYARDLTDIFDLETGQLKVRTQICQETGMGLLSPLSSSFQVARKDKSADYNTSSSPTGIEGPVLESTPLHKGSSQYSASDCAGEDQDTHFTLSAASKEPRVDGAVGALLESTYSPTLPFNQRYTWKQQCSDTLKSNIVTDTPAENILVTPCTSKLAHRKYSTESPVPTESSSADDSNIPPAFKFKTITNEFMRKKVIKTNRQRRLEHAYRRDKRMHGIDDATRLNFVAPSCGDSDSSRQSSKSLNSCELNSRTSGEAVNLVSAKEAALQRVVDDQVDQKEVLHYGGSKSTVQSQDTQASPPASISLLPSSYSERLSNVAPPNQSPFTTKASQKQKYEEDSSEHTKEFVNEGSFEPVGPPNVSLPITDFSLDLQSPVGGIFWQGNELPPTKVNGSTEPRATSTPRFSVSSATNAPGLRDQYDFIREQASILGGRALDQTPRSRTPTTDGFSRLNSYPFNHIVSSPTSNKTPMLPHYLNSESRRFRNMDASRKHALPSTFSHPRFSCTSQQATFFFNGQHLDPNLSRQLDNYRMFNQVGLSDASSNWPDYRTSFLISPQIVQSTRIGNFPTYTRDPYR